MGKRHYIYLSSRKMEPGQVPEGFTVYNDFGRAKIVICGRLMSKTYGLLSYDQPLSRVVMDDYALTDISELPEPILKGFGGIL